MICCWACASCEFADFSSSSKFADSTHLIEYFSDSERISFLISSISALKFKTQSLVRQFSPRPVFVFFEDALMFFMQSTDVVIGLDLFQKFSLELGHFLLHFSLVRFSHRVQRYNQIIKFQYKIVDLFITTVV